MTFLKSDYLKQTYSFERVKEGNIVIAIIILIVVVILILASCIKIVPQANAYVVERLGAYQEPGRLVFISKCRSSTVWQKEFC